MGISEKQEGRFSERDELGGAFCRNNTEVELDVDLVLQENDVCFGLHLKL